MRNKARVRPTNDKDLDKHSLVNMHAADMLHSHGRLAQDLY